MAVVNSGYENYLFITFINLLLASKANKAALWATLTCSRPQSGLRCLTKPVQSAWPLTLSLGSSPGNHIWTTTGSECKHQIKVSPANRHLSTMFRPCSSGLRGEWAFSRWWRGIRTGAQREEAPKAHCQSSGAVWKMERLQGKPCSCTGLPSWNALRMSRNNLLKALFQRLLLMPYNSMK